MIITETTHILVSDDETTGGTYTLGDLVEFGQCCQRGGIPLQTRVEIVNGDLTCTATLPTVGADPT